LLDALSTRGLEKARVLLLQSAVGHAQAHAFQTAAGDVLGNDLIERWMHLVEREDHAGATTLLTVKSDPEGKAVSGEAVHAWLASWGKNGELPPPKHGG